MRFCEPGRAVRGLSISRQCGLAVAERFPRLAQLEIRLGGIRLKPRGLLEMDNRISRSSTTQQRTAKFVLRGRIGRLEAYCLLQWTDGLEEATRLSEA